MAVELISVKCPECGATLNLEEDREQAFCTYCGARILLRNDNEYTYRHINEAEIKQAETERIVRLKELELAEKKQADTERTRSLKIKISLIMAAAGALLIAIGITAGSASEDPGPLFFIPSMIGCIALMGVFSIWVFPAGMNEDKSKTASSPLVNAVTGWILSKTGDAARVPSAVSGYREMSGADVETMLKDAGFTTVKCIDLGDLDGNAPIRPGTVESVTINGSEVTSGGGWYPKDTPVVIFCHSMKQ